MAPGNAPVVPTGVGGGASDTPLAPVSVLAPDVSGSEPTGATPGAAAVLVSGADGVVLVPAGSEGHGEGEEVEVLLYD